MDVVAGLSVFLPYLPRRRNKRCEFEFEDDGSLDLGVVWCRSSEVVEIVDELK